jgi:transcription-repair coupling factor (superfamily II helicase)
LGARKRGFINEIGSDTYQKILNEVIEESEELNLKKICIRLRMISKQRIRKRPIDD